jgi:arylsulfatase A-like enzyme
MMVLDDVGWADVGYHGSDFPTPVIDRLATTEGVRLENYYVQQVCSPTRSALQTGRYPFRIGMQHVTTLVPGSLAAIPEDVPTIAEALKEVGYRRHAIGKWHLGYSSWKHTPLGRGYESYQGYLQGACDYYNKTIGLSTLGKVISLPSWVKELSSGFDFWRNKTAMWEEHSSQASPHYSVDAYQREAQRILANHNPSEPLFLYFAHQNVHEPLQYPPEALYKENCKHVAHTTPLDRNILCTMMNRLDAAIGEFEAMLKKKGMWENTVMWVTTDNGGMLPPGMGKALGGAAGSVSSNFPLRSGKASLFQGGIRGASFVTGGYLPRSAWNTSVTGLLQHVDIPTTLASLAGTKLSSNQDGLNVWDSIVSGAQSPREEVPVNVDTSRITQAIGCVAGHTNEALGGCGEFNALIQGNWKLISGWSGPYDGYSTNDPYHYDVLPANSSTQHYQEVDGRKVWLFDLEKDPVEMINVANQNLQIVRSMQDRLKELASEKQGYRVPQTNLPHARSFPFLHNGTWAPFLSADEIVLQSDDEATLLV